MSNSAISDSYSDASSALDRKGCPLLRLLSTSTGSRDVNGSSLFFGLTHI